MNRTVYLSLFFLLSAAGALTGCGQDELPAAAPADTTQATAEVVDLERFFPDMEGAFVLLEGQSGRMRVHNPERAARQFTPASTFKIPNTLIALETGVASGPDFSLTRDSALAPSRPWWPRSWFQAQTLRSALRNSVVWYYQELARRIGPERMQRYVDQFGYGNGDLSGGIDRFWLESTLAISPYEQVGFLRRLYAGELGLSERSTEIVKELLVLEESPAYRLSGKTGTANSTPTRELGWLVGYVEKGEAVCFYALNMEGEQVWEEWPPSKRTELARAILQEMGVIGSGQAAAGE